MDYVPHDEEEDYADEDMRAYAGMAPPLHCLRTRASMRTLRAHASICTVYCAPCALMLRLYVSTCTRAYAACTRVYLYRALCAFASAYENRVYTCACVHDISLSYS